jgi:hypothetical protein
MWQIYRKRPDGTDLDICGEWYDTEDEAEERAEYLDNAWLAMGDYHLVKEVI